MAYKRATVYSASSKIHILQQHIPELIQTLKDRQPNNEVLQNKFGLWAIIKEYGWNCLQRNGDIISLTYRGDDWNTNSLAFIYIAGRFIEPDGYIRMIDEVNKSYWIYNFNGKWVNRHTIYNRYIDFKDKTDLNNNLIEIISAMFNIGVTKTEIISNVKKIYLNRILK